MQSKGRSYELLRQSSELSSGLSSELRDVGYYILSETTEVSIVDLFRDTDHGIMEFLGVSGDSAAK